VAPWILAIDLGNGGPKVAAVSLEGQVLASAFSPVSVTIETDGTATQDAGEWLTALRSAVREVTAQCSRADLHCVAITGQWGSSVPVAADGSPAGDVLLWADTRAAKHMPELIGGPLSVMGYAPHKVLPFVRITGGGPNVQGADPTGHSQLLQRELRDVGERTVAVLEPVDYLSFRLTGRALATPASMSLSWLTDNRPGAELGYVDKLVGLAGRRREWLPELVPTGTIAGPLLGPVADELGLLPGVPVTTGLPDLHAAVVGSGAVGPYDTHLAVSTTAWLTCRVPFKKTDILHSIATLPGLDSQYPLVGNNIETAGAALAWLREQIISPDDGLVGGGTGIGASGAAPPGAVPSYDQILELAASAPVGCEGLIFMPWLAGERSPVEDHDLRAGWLNLSLRTDRAALVRSVLEGVALNLRWLLTHYEKFLNRPVATIRALGGGIRSDLWCQIIASTLDRPIEQVADPLNAQLRGVAMWARVCLGELTLAQTRNLVPVQQVFEPEPGDRVIYEEHYREFRKLYGSLKGFYHRLNGG